MTDLPKTFEPAAIEAKWYAHWEGEGLFRPERPDAQPFTIVNPPPNVTGSLHIGHALDNTLQDIVIRYERLRGKDALWVVGTDHAGIATQMVVERQMEARQDKRTNYTREQFIDKVWEWKAESGGTITGQLRRLGCSMDWSREQFTMDPHFTRAVVKVFVDLYNEGLIYRDKRLVNWDPGLKTAISDLEVETREVQGYFWHFRYPLADGVTLANGQDHIEVATTRPETMLADMAVAVHPDDERYAGVVGKHVDLPITGRHIPIVADEHADPALGTGAVKITPGHDFNDFEVGRRAGIAAGEMLNMLDADAHVCQTADGLIPEAYLGLERFEARKAVVAALKESGHLVLQTGKTKAGEPIELEAEPRTIQTPYGDRSGVVIEPWLTDQWYVDAATLAKPAIEAVRSGAIEIVPKTWEKTYFNWMENIQPWCVSRQLWWGHRIPAYYGPLVSSDGAKFFDDVTRQNDQGGMFVFVEPDDVSAIRSAEKLYGGIEWAEFRTFDRIVIFDDLQSARRAYQADPAVLPLWRDQDVLDTWFSSALWPFATLGWPNQPSPGSGEGGERSEPGEGSDASEGAPPSPQPSPRGGEGADLVARHYPNDLLISGFDILFFWDARMAMQGIHFMKDVPWRRLYLHGLVRAADGQKMSKSKGNVVDPLLLIDKYGADALRFFMAAMESQGRDVKMDEKRVEGYRNFATKLWNATRFAMSNGIGASATVAAPAATLPVNRWIIGEVVQTVAALDKAMAELRFDAAANAIYHFVWDRFCDWYLELIKPVLSNVEGPVLSQVEGPVPGAALSTVQAEPVEAPSFSSEEKDSPSTSSGRTEVEETKAVAGWVLDQILVMLHPFMPFVTEELWHALGDRPYELIVAQWPEPGASVDGEAAQAVEWFIDLTSKLRNARNELGLPPGQRLTGHVNEVDPATQNLLNRWASALTRIARVDMSADPAPAGATISIVVGEATYVFPLEGIIDVAAEKARLAKALEAATKEAKSLEGRLNNPAFVEKAKPEAVEKARVDHAERAAEAERLAAALARLG